jgi:hypothetical protein
MIKRAVESILHTVVVDSTKMMRGQVNYTSPAQGHFNFRSKIIA